MGLVGALICLRVKGYRKSTRKGGHSSSAEGFLPLPGMAELFVERKPHTQNRRVGHPAPSYEVEMH
jgi:hypothetical protein